MSRSKRIVHITTVHPLFDTRIFYKELQTLKADGYDVVLVVPHERDEIVDEISIRAIPRVQGKFKRVLTAGYYAVKRALREDAAVYHLHDPELLLWSQWLRIRGKRVIYDMHENVPFALRHKSWIPNVMRRILIPLYRLCERLLMYRMPVIFAETSYTDAYRWIHTQHTTVLNMPKASELLAVNTPKNEQPVIGYIGDVTTQRGSMMTLEALRLLQQQGKRVEWECVGQITDQHRHDLLSFIELHDLHGVRLYGRLKPAEWHSLIAQCHIGLAVLAPLPNYTRSYPTKLFEYMALGVPVIASNFPLYREIVETNDCGLLVSDSKNPSQLADAIMKLLDDPERAAQMGANGRAAIADKYRWDIEAQKLIAFYKHVLTT